MPPSSTSGPAARTGKPQDPERRPGPTRALTLLVLTLALLPMALLAGGCSSDDASSSGERSRGGGRGTSEAATTDSGSRFMDAAGPVGGLTAETPPVVAPGAPLPNRP